MARYTDPSMSHTTTNFLPVIKTGTSIPEGRVSVLDGDILTRPGVIDDPFLPRMGVRDLKSRQSVNMDGGVSVLDGLSTRDVRSRASINTRDVRSRISIATRDVKSRASSRRENSGYYRKGRMDLSSQFRELLKKRLMAISPGQQKNKIRHTPKVQDIEVFREPVLNEKLGELGQLFTVLRPTVPDTITFWPRDVLSQKFYSSHDQRHAVPRSLGGEERSDRRGRKSLFSEENVRENKHSASSRQAVTSASSQNIASQDGKQIQQCLEELYTDKKFLDKIIDFSVRGSDERIFAELGRDFLVDRASYWARRGPSPERPPATNLGLQLKRTQSFVM